jgi:beta-N-acetylhexosaminidase
MKGLPVQDIKKIERIAGQRIMAGFIGTELNHDLKFLIDTIGVGGIILFSRNIINRDQLKNLCNDAAAHATACSRPPLLVAIDQEGGTVARLKTPDFTEFQGAPFIKDANDAERFAAITAKELLDVGINMDMAPVMDVVPQGFDGIMSERVFSHDPLMVANLGCSIINRLQSSGVMAVAKHFPGIGRTTLDSHLLRPDLDASFESLSALELVPFRAAIASGVSGIMLSHIRYTGFDDQWPASLSTEIALNLLRNQMGYSGVVMTDDLEMGAVENHYDMAVMTRQVLDAEVDIALVCKTRQKIEHVFESICRQLTDNAAFMEKAGRSANRITALKQKYLPDHHC